MLFAAAAFAAGATGAGAQITSLPATADFEDGTTGFFEGGKVNSGNSLIGNVMSVTNSTATATFDMDADEEGNQPYTFSADNEQVTFNFTAYQGWSSGSHTATVSINNSEGQSLLSYTYSIGTCSVTDVSIGGTTVTGFQPFDGQNKASTASTKGSANGFGTGSGSQDYKNTDGYNPIVTMSVAGVGYVEFRFVTADKGVNVFYSGQLPAGIKVDLGSMTITCDETNSDRSIGIDNLTITSETLQATFSKYTLERVCDGVTLTSEELSGIEGNSMSVSTDAFYTSDGKKYIYVSDDADEVGAIADGKTYTITYREAEIWNYTVDAVDASGNPLGEVKSGTNYENETFDIGFPAYINVDGTIYKTEKQSNGGYYFTQTLSADNTSKTITYTESDITGVVYLSEAEAIEGLTLTDNSNTAIRSSNGASAYAKDADVVFASLPNGKYKIGAVFCDASSGNSTWSFKAGEETVFTHTVSAVNWDEGVSDEFTLNGSSTGIALAQGGNASLGVDLIYIIKTGEAELIVPSEPRSWDFTAMSDADEALLVGDDNWTDNKSRYQNNGIALQDEPIIVGGTELEMTKGLYFTAEAGKLLLGSAVNGSNHYMQVQKNSSFRIPDLALGDTVRMVVCSASSAGVTLAMPDPMVAKVVEGCKPVTGQHTCTLVMMRSGDLTLTGTNDLRFYSLETKPGGTAVGVATGVADIAAFKALEPGTEARLVLNNARITYAGVNADTGISMYIEDNSGAIVFDTNMSGIMSQLGYQPGMAAYGYITAVSAATDDGTPCISIGYNVTDFFINEPATVDIVPTSMTIAEVSDEDNVSKLIILKEVSLSVNEADGNIYATDNDNTILVTDKFAALGTDVSLPAKLESLTAIVGVADGTYQLYPTAYTGMVTDGIDAISSAAQTSADVYTVSGTKVRTAGKSLDGLGKGIYIVGGKKVVIR